MEWKNCSIYVSSSDKYSDIWPLFFKLFKYYWPEYTGKIYLNTETLNYTYEDLNIICTQVGKDKPFGEVFNLGLNAVATQNILLFMIDYLFMDKVDCSKLAQYYQFFEEEKLDSLCLIHQNYDYTIQSDHIELQAVKAPSKDMFSFQVAFWKKDILKTLIYKNENPWASEWFGTKRANKKKIKLQCLQKNVPPPISYDLAGCLHKGMWLENARDHLTDLKIQVDYTKRGFYNQKHENSLRNKIKVKYWLLMSGIKGSYFY
jgi:hypothetical protein